MPLDETRLIVVVKARKASGDKEVVVTYIVPVGETPTPGLNLTPAQKDKLTTRLQQMSLVVDENDTQL